MTIRNLAEATIIIEDSLTTMQDISAQVLSGRLTVQHMTHSFASLSGEFTESHSGAKTVQIRLRVAVTDGTNDAYNLLSAWLFSNPPGTRTVVIGLPDDVISGAVTYSGVFRLDGESVVVGADGAGDDAQSMTVTLINDGDVVRALVA